jgi:hypothetical protein
MAEDTTPTIALPSDQEKSAEVDAEVQAQVDLDKARKTGGEVDRKYDGWRTPRRTHEFQWFLNAAYRKGKQSSESIQSLSSLQDISKLDRRKKNIANILWSKTRARFAKFAKTRPKALVVPFNTDRKARLDARATEHALDYFYQRSEQEQAYLDVLLHAADTGKAYWWFSWDESKPGVVRQKNEVTGTESLKDAQLGDIVLDVENAFPVLVPNLGITHIKDQPEVIRARVKDVEDMKARYPDFQEHIKADQHMDSPFEFERQIAHLSGTEAGALASMQSDRKGPQTGVLVKEHFTKPNAKYPHGRYTVVMNGIAVKDQDELPNGFWDMENPYPCAEFMDMLQVGQFYVTAFIEQLIPLQRGYNMLRDKLERQIELNIHPKWMVARQARISQAALTNESGEVVEFNYIPGMPEPHTITPGNVAADAWRFAQMLLKEFDQISQVQPAFEGRTGGAKSGLQTNLLQEASDSVHSPDARGYELAVLDASYKIRRMMKKGYDVARLISFSGRGNTPEVFEFSSENIDEHATIVVQIGSALSQFKATRIQQLMDLHEKGMLGDPKDPELRRRVLGMIDLGGLEKFQEEARQDEDNARSENIDMTSGLDVPIPMFYEDHLAHYQTHTEELKSPANKNMDADARRRILAHTLLHMKFINPGAAFQLAMEYGFQELIGQGTGKIPPPPPPQPGPPGGPPGQAQPPQPQRPPGQ